MSRVRYSGGKGVQLSLSWVSASGGEVPHGAVEASSGCYVARARLNDDWIPGKLPEGHSNAYVAFGGEEHGIGEYQVLVQTNIGSLGDAYDWQPASGGTAPKRALVAGSDNGEPLFVARAEVEGEMCVGKVHPGHDCGHFPWGGKEHSVDEYEVLVLN